MGPENKNDHLVVYIDGKPAELVREPVQFVVAHTEGEEIVPDTPDFSAFSAGGISTAEFTDALNTVSRMWAAEAANIEKMARALARAWEFQQAVKWAEAYNRPLAYRYHHTKKKRTRKKYAKRILAWYREEIL